MTTRRQVKAGLRGCLVAVSGLPPAARRKWQNRDFKPPAVPTDVEGTGANFVWVEDAFLYGASTLRELNSRTRTRRTEIYQISLRAPRDFGTNILDDLADAIEDAFRAATILGDPGNEATALTINDVGVGPPLEETTWWHLPVSIFFQYDH
jgi:hypothetical protein